VKPVWTNATN